MTTWGRSSITRHGARFGVAYVVAIAWVLVAVAFPSRPLETAAAAGDPIGPQVDLGGPVPGSPASQATIPDQGAGRGPDGPGAAPVPDAVRPTETSAGPATTEEVATEVGVSRAGVRCEGGARQVPGSSYAAPCVPAFEGDNGGATARGVHADRIRIVRRSFPETANSQAVSAVVQQAGGADHSVTRAVREDFIRAFEEHYELYGRRVEWIDYESRFGNSTSEAQGKGREGACLDAEVVAVELEAFAVIGDTGGVSKVFAECAAQRGVVVLDGASYSSATFYRQHHPYIWAIAMDCERIVYQVLEYLYKRLHDRPARWAGNAETREKRRRFGTYTPVSDGDDTCGNVITSELARYGIDEGSSTYYYTLDVSRFPDEAARGVIQFKRDGVTTLILAADPISVIFLTQSATSQNWWPEWFIIGVALTDVDNAARLYDQGQVNGSLFGMSQLGPTAKILGPTSEPGVMYQHFTGRTIPAGTSGQYFNMTHVYNMLQAAGPVLTPDNLGRGAYTLPPGGAPDYPAGWWSFLDGPDGTPGAGDHTLIDDSREVYWRSDVRSPADGQAGTYIETYGGRRFRNGEWPAEEPPVYP